MPYKEYVISLFYRMRDIFSLSALLAIVMLMGVSAPIAYAEVSSLSPINLAQAPVVPPQFIPTDVTPFTVAPERNNFSPGYRFRLFQALPERLWFNMTTEVSQRLDTNVLFTYSKPKADYAFRVLPNISLGYEVLKNTSVYCNYFVIKDIFARDYFSISFPTTQSLSMGIRHNKQLGQKTNLQFDFQARELWQTAGLRQFDFLPNITLSHVFNPRNVLFFSTLLQLRGGDYFVAPTREIDPFWTVGYIHSKGLWTFIAEDTFVANFRRPPFNDAIPNQSNMTMIADIEVNHPLTKKIPSLLAFIRAEPIWNWDSDKMPGLSGFDFRLFTGLRLSANKPSYYSTIENIRKQAMPDRKSKKKGTKDPDSVGSDTGAPSAVPADILLPLHQGVPGEVGENEPNVTPASPAPSDGSPVLEPLPLHQVPLHQGQPNQINIENESSQANSEVKPVSNTESSESSVENDANTPTDLLLPLHKNLSI